MEYNEYKLSDGALLKSYIREDISGKCGSHKERPAIIVFPGGGYEYLSPRESEPIVLEFLSNSNIRRCSYIRYKRSSGST